MPSKSRHDLRRSTSTRVPERRILIVCEGKITEPQYLGGVRSTYRLPAVKIEGAHPDPLELVQSAVKKRDAVTVDPYDEVWCVFDVEYPVGNHVQEAIALAQDEGFFLANSNPCFELWLILHYRECASHMSTSAACSMADRLDGYSNKHVDFSKFSDNVDAAIKRSVRLDVMHAGDGKICPDDNPSSRIGDLVSNLIRSSERD
jgi:hypothetical protein